MVVFWLAGIGFPRGNEADDITALGVDDNEQTSVEAADNYATLFPVVAPIIFTINALRVVEHTDRVLKGRGVLG